LLHFDLEALVRTAGYIGLFAIIFAESGLLIGFFLPGDSLLFTAGFVASQGALDIRLLVPLCFIAAVTGDAVGYAFGHHVGRRLYARPDSRFFRKAHLLRAEEFFARHGGKAIILARFVPIVRTFAPIVAGMGSMRYARFAAINLVGGLLWAVGITVSGYFLGSTIPDIDKYLLPIIAAIIFLSVAPSAFHIWKESRAEISLWVGQRIGRAGRPPKSPNSGGL
jgi:membrane-associated protein